MIESWQRKELWARYRRIWLHSWRRRKALDTSHRLSHEIQFLPAALALQEQPVHPAPRYLALGLMGFAAFAFLWACFGRIDVVATAGGKIVPSGKTKIIQPHEVSVVKAIHVEDGQRVKANDLLIELDTSVTAADVQRLRNDMLAANVDLARAQALLDAIRLSQKPALDIAQIPGATKLQRASAQRWLDGQYLEFRSAVDQASAEMEQRSAEIQAAQAVANSIRNILPITRELVDDYKTLLNDGSVAKHSYLEKYQVRLDQERELATSQLKVQELVASKRVLYYRRASIIDQHRRAMLDLQGEAELRSLALAMELSKAEQRHRFKRLLAPVDGTVQQLAIHTRGGVVTEAQPLMVIVPDDQPLEVEVMIENKDIGFVYPGQKVEVKVETFTFTKYGVIPATIISISSDAIENEKLGLVYSARIQLSKKYIRVGERDVPLAPGMAVRAEVITDTRRVISYFLSPLKKYVSESLGER
ncbi:HlyD family type I secretion periplasmic adaptor subunit [Pseudomonas sp. LP_7_YM]|uniref:HlyD family type I secretion periplasmic adaptor subunit n=1 Tax=Pseudomonas sp. LP_7_YM TaxID=2485137 RepID=UPI00105F3105|nr:HlyD family type I secretion periplasmic adaptor subunit [Pseudomonas sp. LP_7_YM]TDV69942.1 hemolysin D [Pseudomonas sp. LP_7_YM]